MSRMQRIKPFIIWPLFRGSLLQNRRQTRRAVAFCHKSFYRPKGTAKHPA